MLKKGVDLLDEKGAKRLGLSADQLFGLYLVALFFVYSPAFLMDYCLHNDYLFLATDKSQWFNFPENGLLVMMGRPLNALLLSLQYHYINNLQAFRISRFISFLFTVASSWLFFQYFIRKLSLNPYWAIFLTFCIFTLPSSQVYIAWGIHLIPGSLNLFLAVLSYILYDEVKLDSTLLRLSPNLLRFFGALFVFFISFFIYPPTSLFFLVFTFSKLFFLPSVSPFKTLKFFLRDTLLCGPTMAAYYVLNRFVVLPALLYWWPSLKYWQDTLNSLAFYEFAVSYDLLGKSRLFFDLLTIAFSGVWHTLFGNVAAYIYFFLLLIFGLVIILFTLFKKYSLSLPSLFVKISLGIALLLLSNAPMLLASKVQVVFGYRMLYPTAAIGILILFGLLFHYRSSFHVRGEMSLSFVVAILLVLASGILTTRNMINTGMNADMELSYIRQQLSLIDFSKKNHLTVIAPQDNRPILDRRVNLEFSYPAVAVPPLGIVRNIVHFALSQLGVGRFPSNFHLNFEYVGKPTLQFNESTAIIDMNIPRPASRNNYLERWKNMTTEPADPFRLVSVSGGYERESKGKDWWFWAYQSLNFQYAVSNKVYKARLKFTYLGINPDRVVKVIIHGKEITELRIQMKSGWNEYISTPIELERRDVTIQFIAEGRPVRISDKDSRLVSFVIKNCELQEVNPFELISASGGYPVEKDGKDWWCWTPKRLSFEYRNSENISPIRIKFSYFSISDGRNLKILIQGNKKIELVLKMKPGHHEVITEPVELDSAYILLELNSDGKPVPLSEKDFRLASFYVKNIEFMVNP